MSEEKNIPPPDIDFDGFLEWYKENIIGDNPAKDGMSGGGQEFAKRFIELLDNDPELKKLLIAPNRQTKLYGDIVEYLRDMNKEKKLSKG